MAVPDSIESLQTELARLFKLMTDARDSGNQALADLLAEQAARYLVKIADLSAPQQPVAQQQQQVQPDEEGQSKK
jgi:hypothetical protein